MRCRALIVLASALAACTGSAAPTWQMPALAPSPPDAVLVGVGPDVAGAAESGDGARWGASSGLPSPETGALAPARGLWHTDEARAVGEARARGRGLVVDFSAEWCLPCMVLARDTLSDESVEAELFTHFVALRVDVTEETTASRELLSRYRVRGLPAIVVLDADGAELDRIGHYLDPDSFLSRLERARTKTGPADARARR